MTLRPSEALAYATLILAGSACGAVAREAPASGCDDGGNINATTAAEASGGGAVHTAVSSSELVPLAPILHCGADTVAIILPCKLGLAPLYAVECDLNNGAHWNFLFVPPVPDSKQPLDLSQLPVTPAQRAATTARGQLTLFEVNLEQRAFLGRLTHLELDFEGSTCSLDNGLLWAIPGNFL